MIEIYTDGSCRGKNQKGASNIGGHSRIIFLDEERINIYCASEENTTNNRQELRGLIEAMDFAVNHPKEKFHIICDSSYCVNMCNDWIHSWANNDWKNSKKQTVENLDLVKEVYQYLSGFPNFSISQTKGHAGELGNELADLAAKNDIVSLMKLIDEYGLTIENYVNLSEEI